MRGDKEPVFILPLQLPWITPACAGISGKDICVPPTQGDHPRMRGDKVACRSFAISAKGSPPHARG